MTLQQKLEEIKERSSRQWGLNEFQATKDISALILALAKCIEQRDNNLVQKDKAMSHGFILDLSELRDLMNEQLLAIFEGDEHE
jgi:hypothetical protein